ncbi:type IV pilus assembly protein PilZ [Leptospira fainei serovar Hurstbridge str. BUT 6]|uniref:Type IV pilus assembly protein PilZ n=1 Tax=Leptospira fainei serovar Hurstbridge str. BUT 6 TaxID=1193011 RepID=S3UX87_9LEPT|nr:PilZ domain-containing protein [Leptospira fainei]EPG74991.1 type IV pilus assembly protein PilZ [Leptospira fainei serovar Hurstbridge str. BUT 6]
MEDERRKGDRIKTVHVLEMSVLAVTGKGAIKGNVHDISNYGIAIIDYVSSKTLKIHEKIIGVISGNSIEDINFSGRIVRMDTVESNTGLKRIIGIEFLNVIPNLDELVVLGLNSSKSLIRM